MFRKDFMPVSEINKLALGVQDGSNAEKPALRARVRRAVRRALGEGMEAPDKVVSKVALVDGGSVLMGQRNDNGKWTFPGGHAEDNESPLEAAIREVKEETDVDLSPGDLTLMKSKRVLTDDGDVLDAHGWRCDMPKEKVTAKGDPDNEVAKWEWVDMASPLFTNNVLPELHVPLGRCAVMEGLGIKPTQESKEEGEELPPPDNPLKRLNKILDKMWGCVNELEAPADAAGLDPKEIKSLEDKIWDMKRGVAKAQAKE